jgi:excisionase family DNA binding protein
MTVPTNEKLLLNAREAAELLGIGPGLVYKMVKRREIPRVTLGNRVLVPRRELEEWIAKQAASSMDQIKPMLVSSERKKQG